MVDLSEAAWQTLTTPEIEELVRGDPVVVLPLAAIEQHGPHLPLSTDVEIGLGILRSALHKLPSGFPVSVLPVQGIGTSLEHENFSGTLSLSARTLEATVCEIGRGLARAGVRRLVLSNSHGGNRGVMDAAGLRLRAEEGLLVVKASYFDFPPEPEGAIDQSEWRHGLHGGAVETSMMLHLRPELVRRDRTEPIVSLGQDLESDGSRIRPDRGAAFSWLADDLHPSGVAGDATIATAALGEGLVEHYGSILSEILQDARRFPLERLVGAPK